jgi:NADH dehydrogenase
MTVHPSPASEHGHRVVVIGAGFAGLFAAKALRREPVEVTLIDRTSHHLFQPLLYQVATGILSEGEIAPPVRDVIRRQANIRVMQAEVTGIDLEARTVTATGAGVSHVIPYDSLVVAAGASQSYFGHDEFAEFAPGMKTLDDAISLRGRIFGAFERAEAEPQAELRRALLTFVVVGAGPTGVEMAGQLIELSRRSLRDNFRNFDPSDTRVVLVEAGALVLPTFGRGLSERAHRDLEQLGVDVTLGTRVVAVDAHGVEVTSPVARYRIEARTTIWAAGVSASPLAALLASASGAALDRQGRLLPNPDLSVPSHPEVFVVGDMMGVTGVPGDAQAAIQAGRFVARRIATRLHGRPSTDGFVCHAQGQLATIARFRALAAIGPFRLTGVFAWVIWLAVHLVNLVGFKNRVSVLMHWAVTFIGRGHSERTAPFADVAMTRRTRSHPLPPPPGSQPNKSPANVTCLPRRDFGDNADSTRIPPTTPEVAR